MTFEEILEKDGRLVYTNKGVSMLPLLRQNKDVMVIEKRDEYHVLDAVLFRRPGENGAYVMHRILRDNGDGTYWIVGDNCVSGETVRRGQILGLLTARIRNGRTLAMDSPRLWLYTHTWCRWWRPRFFILTCWRVARAALGKVYRAVWGRGRKGQ